MSNRYEGIKCPVCNGYLFEDADDIVVCPLCGAPHHRACYHSIGHCGLEVLHGTDQQYDKVQKARQEKEEHAKAEAVCPHCGKPIAQDTLCCPHCGKMPGEAEQPQPETPFRHYAAQIDPLGGVHPATDLGNGVTAKEAASFIKMNTTRYIPKFASHSKTSWNWLAFLLPHGFFFFRKMYKQGFLASAIYIAATVLSMPWQAEWLNMISTLPVNATQRDLFAKIASGDMRFTSAAILLLAVSLLLNLALRILCGLFADRWYKSHVLRTVKQLSSLEPEEREEKYIKKGMPNLYILLLVTLAFSWLPGILLLFF